MDHIAAIITAVASLLWPLVGFTAIFLFKNEISLIFGRLTKGEILGQKFELSETLGELKASAAAVAVETKELPKEELQIPTDDQFIIFDQTIKSILRQAENNPKLALITLAAELEKQARQALATRGLLGGRPTVSISQALSELNQYGFPPNLSGSLKLFLDVRNKIVHGATATDSDALSALDSGISILRTLNALPNTVNTIYHPGVDIFSDAECRHPINDAKGVVLETTSPGGAIKTRNIFPTTRTHFQKGKRVAWEWNSQKTWGAGWYYDPDTHDIKHGWDASTEFIGRHLDDI